MGLSGGLCLRVNRLDSVQKATDLKNSNVEIDEMYSDDRFRAMAIPLLKEWPRTMMTATKFINFFGLFVFFLL